MSEVFIFRQSDWKSALKAYNETSYLSSCRYFVFCVIIFKMKLRKQHDKSHGEIVFDFHWQVLR